MSDKKVVKSVKPPLGIVPRFIRDEERISEIYSAMGRYIKAKKQIPTEWTKEIIDLSKENFSK